MANFVWPPIEVSATFSGSGLATEAKQDTGNTSLSSIDSKLTDNATATKQDTGNTSLSSIDGKLTDVATATKQDTGNSSLATIAGDTTSLDAKVPSQGAAATAASIPVNIASDQTVPVSASSLPLPSGAATEAKQDTGNTSLSNIDTSLNNIEADMALLEDRLAGSLVPEEFDYQALTYVAAGNGAGEVETITYKTGGAGGSTVATITLTYDASDRVSTVTRT